VPVKASDKLEVHFPLSLRFEALSNPLNLSMYNGYGTIMYGPIMLAALGADTDRLILNKDARSLEKVVIRNSTSVLSFSATTAADCGTTTLGSHEASLCVVSSSHLCCSSSRNLRL